MQCFKFGDLIRNIQNKLGNRTFKSDLKSTVADNLSLIDVNDLGTYD